MAKPPRCKSKTAKGRRCKNAPVHGAEHCASHLGRAGRVSSFDGDVEERILNMLRAGNYVEVAVAAAGVGRTTYYDWLKRGDAEGTEPADAPFREFRERVEKARAEGEGRMVALVAKAAATDWRAAAFMLERQYPDRWARPSQRIKPEDEAAGKSTRAGDPMDELEEGADVIPIRRS